MFPFVFVRGTLGAFGTLKVWFPTSGKSALKKRVRAARTRSSIAWCNIHETYMRFLLCPKHIAKWNGKFTCTSQPTPSCPSPARSSILLHHHLTCSWQRSPSCPSPQGQYTPARKKEKNKLSTISVLLCAQWGCTYWRNIWLRLCILRCEEEDTYILTQHMCYMRKARHLRSTLGCYWDMTGEYILRGKTSVSDNAPTKWNESICMYSTYIHSEREDISFHFVGALSETPNDMYVMIWEGRWEEIQMCLCERKTLVT